MHIVSTYEDKDVPFVGRGGAMPFMCTQLQDVVEDVGALASFWSYCFHDHFKFLVIVARISAKLRLKETV